MSRGQDSLIILVAPEMFGQNPDLDQLRSATSRAGRSIRILVRIKQETQIAFAEALDRDRNVTELLIAASVPPTDTRLRCAQMPSGSNESDLDEIALAMSDLVLVQSKAGHDDLLRRATDLGKRIIEPTGQLPTRANCADVSGGLDPDRGFWSGIGRHVCGRFSQFIVALLAFDIFNSQQSGFRRSWRILARCLSLRGVVPAAYFCIPDVVQLLDKVSAPGRLAQYLNRFEALDRTALYGSFINHDISWITHLCGALAVAEAVTGALTEGGIGWPIAEFVTLTVIAVLIYLIRRGRIQERWTVCRFGAEYLRITLIFLGFLLLPGILQAADPPPEAEARGASGSDLLSAVLRSIKATVRDYGLPGLGFSESPRDSVLRLHIFVQDQLAYHRINYIVLDRAEKRLRIINGLIFLAVMATVACEIAAISKHIEPNHSLLLVTAAGPAIAAAFHGASTRVGIAHRAASSETSERELGTIVQGLEDMLGREKLTAADWPEARDFAKRAMTIMERDIAADLGNSRLQPDTLPA